jgi:hypothetical protein
VKISEFRKIVKEEIQNALESAMKNEDKTLAQAQALSKDKSPRGYHDITKDFGKTTTKQDLGVKRYANKVEPELKRRIEAIRFILTQLKPGSREHRDVQDILDKAENEMKMPTDRQMDLISYLYSKVALKEGGALSGMEGAEILQKWGLKKPNWSIPAPNDEKDDRKWRKN